jgi:hypothetical protein
MTADNEDTINAGEGSLSYDDNASQTTEDDPSVPQPHPSTIEFLNHPPAHARGVSIVVNTSSPSKAPFIRATELLELTKGGIGCLS